MINVQLINKSAIYTTLKSLRFDELKTSQTISLALSRGCFRFLDNAKTYNL